jgi:hypothetical protein
MKYLRRIFENINDDISDVLLDLKDEGFRVYKESFNLDSDYPFTDEFLIYKIGNSGYYVDTYEVELFSISVAIYTIQRFKDICELYNRRYRIIIHDGEFIIDITKSSDSRLSNRFFTPEKEEILDITHLHLKNRAGTSGKVDLNNLKFISFQILK